MEVFKLPPSTIVKSIVPKKKFDKYINTKQKKGMTDLILRILWENKLSRNTVNLEPIDIQEIQIFNIELKRKGDINNLLDIIDKAISYHIIFIIAYEDAYYISTSSKHTHPTKPDTSVIDCNFRSAWLEEGELPYKLHLAQSLDETYLDFCKQLSGLAATAKIKMPGLILKQQEIAQVEKVIARLQAQMKSCKQFKLKVELNIELHAKTRLLEELLGKQI